MNGRAPPAVDLSDWLNVCPTPDILAIGFQEVVPLNASNVVLGRKLFYSVAVHMQMFNSHHVSFISESVSQSPYQSV